MEAEFLNPSGLLRHLQILFILFRKLNIFNKHQATSIINDEHHLQGCVIPPLPP